MKRNENHEIYLYLSLSEKYNSTIVIETVPKYC